MFSDVKVHALVTMQNAMKSIEIRTYSPTSCTLLTAQPEIDVMALTGTFVCLCFLAATQDIAVDGWALTMLKRLV